MKYVSKDIGFEDLGRMFVMIVKNMLIERNFVMMKLIFFWLKGIIKMNLFSSLIRIIGRIMLRIKYCGWCFMVSLKEIFVNIFEVFLIDVFVKFYFELVCIIEVLIFEVFGIKCIRLFVYCYGRNVME